MGHGLERKQVPREPPSVLRAAPGADELPIVGTLVALGCNLLVGLALFKLRVVEGEPPLKQPRQQGDEGRADDDDAASGHKLFHALSFCSCEIKK